MLYPVMHCETCPRCGFHELIVYNDGSSWCWRCGRKFPPGLFAPSTPINRLPKGVEEYRYWNFDLLPFGYAPPSPWEIEHASEILNGIVAVLTTEPGISISLTTRNHLYVSCLQPCSLAGVLHYVKHPGTKTFVESLGAVPAPGEFVGWKMQVGERVIVFDHIEDPHNVPEKMILLVIRKDLDGE